MLTFDMVAAVTRKDYEDRRRRQSEGTDQAKASEKYRGKAINPKLHDTIAILLAAHKSYTDIVKRI